MGKARNGGDQISLLTLSQVEFEAISFGESV